MRAFPAKLTQAKLAGFGETGWAGICSLLMSGIALLSFPRAEVLTPKVSNAQFSLWQLQGSVSVFLPLLTATPIKKQQQLPATPCTSFYGSS